MRDLSSSLNYPRTMKQKLSKDYLKYLNLELYQREDMFRYNTDTLILGSFMDDMPYKAVMDIGTNNGALLLYAAHKKASKLIGVDIFKEALEVAEINLKNTGKEYELICSRIQDLEHEKADVIVCNPPFFEMNNVTENRYYKAAMFEESMPLEDMFKAFRKFVKDNGIIYTLYPADRFPEFYEMAKKYKLKFMRLKFVHEKNKPYALRFAVKMKIGPMTKVRIEEPVFIENGEILQ